MSTRTVLTDFLTYAWIGLCLASLVITICSSCYRGWIGFGFGLLSMFGVALSLFLIFGLVVGFGESGGPFQLDSLGLNGAGAIGLTLFVLGARCGLRRKTGEPKPPPLVIFLFLGFSWVATMQTHADTLYVSSVNSNKVYVISSTGTVTPFATINLL